MEAQPKSMQQKRARHFPETKLVIAASLIIFGVSFLFSLVILWPQNLLVSVFDQRLTFQLMVDNEDYYTCSPSYQGFVVDRPTADYQMLSFYVFNVSNANEIIERGDQPVVTETGPYAFVKYTYKYDVLFNEDSTTVTFKEFSYLNEILDPDYCEKMFYRLEKDYLQDDPCANDKCACKSIDSPITVVNPLFLKIIWEDKAFDLLSLYSVEVFQTQKQLLNGPFLEAVRAHMVSKALKEVYLFRIDMQVGQVFLTAYNYMRNTLNWTNAQIAETVKADAYCGLDAFSINTNLCPLTPLSILNSITPSGFSSSDIPSLAYFYDSANDIAVTNTSYGMPRFLGLAYYYGNIDFNSNSGYTMANDTSLALLEAEFISKLGYLAFGSTNLTSGQYAGCRLAIRATARQLGEGFVSTYRSNSVVIQNVYIEFNSTYEPVICAPLGEKCLYQYGYLQHVAGGKLFPLNSPMIRALIDISTEVSTEMNNFYKDLNAPRWYNVLLYFYDVLNAGDGFHIQCTNLADTIEDATFNQPAALWGSYRGISAVNRTLLFLLYKEVPTAEKKLYFDLATNLSSLMQRTYRNATDFHDNFVINYINKYKDVNLTHVFNVDNFEELGIAQWAGGFVTHAISYVRTTRQIVRDGMWNFGLTKYYEYFLEYSSYCVSQGFPYAWMYDIDQAKSVLDLLSSNTIEGLEFRRHIMYIGSTFIGDGVNYVNDIGSIGEVTFTREFNLGNFSCPDHPSNAYECSILADTITSSSSQCDYVQSLFDTCQNQYTFQSNGWIDVDNCAQFETSSTSPDVGIQCDSLTVFGNSHPYTKTRGNVIFQMLYSLAVKIVLWDKLWCDFDYTESSTATCSYDRGGLFASTTVKKVLFEGYTEPSVLKYMDLKHSLYNNISLSCVEDAFDICGVKNYDCNQAGVYINFPNNYSYLMRYNTTEYDQFFTHEFTLTDNSYTLLWPLGVNESVATLSNNVINAVNNYNLSYESVYQSTDDAYLEEYLDKYANTTSIITFRNFIWTAFPAWDNYFDGENEVFLKYYQCQNRILFGNIKQFKSCYNEMYTGRDDLTKILQINRYYGNQTIYPYYNINITTNSTEDVRTSRDISYEVYGSTINNQYQYYQYNGFQVYPYVYNGLSAGADINTQKELAIFSKVFGMEFILTQDDLVFQFQRDISLSLPLSTGPDVQETVYSKFVLPSRRFTESADSWNIYTSGIKLQDQYTMPYYTPIAMASVQSYTNFPVFIETPHSYGNALWGGLEYTLVQGTEQNEYAQRTYADYDPVTGRAIRSALRQQVNMRVEANALFQNVFSSQQRCTPPAKASGKATGYGCFAYIPLLWYEEARVIDNATLFRFYDHFYTRPDRGNVLTSAGIALGIMLIIVGSFLCTSELYQRRRFNTRVYVD